MSRIVQSRSFGHVLCECDSGGPPTERWLRDVGGHRDGHAGVGDPGPPHFFAIKLDERSMKTKTSQTAFAGANMNEMPVPNRANRFEAGPFSLGRPAETAR